MSMPFKIGVLQLSMEPLQETVRMAQACGRCGIRHLLARGSLPWWRKALHGGRARPPPSLRLLP